GGSAGSTSGSMKLMRVIVLAKHGLLMARKEIHPRAIMKVRFSGSVVSDDVIMRILGFFLLFMFLFFIFAILLGAMGLDFETALGASIAAIGNIGPGLGDVGPASNFSSLPSAAKILLSFGMLLGRLELYTVLVLLTPMFWKKT
ncbi:MAG: TrkH family potassium uptake protein, partial [Candidatus Eisenbacteria bacterium]|nr:TrkH family potassium uptake protein [Candidatus Eisenbacteria bacterium]